MRKKLKETPEKGRRVLLASSRVAPKRVVALIYDRPARQCEIEDGFVHTEIARTENEEQYVNKVMAAYSRAVNVAMKTSPRHPLDAGPVREVDVTESQALRAKIEEAMHGKKKEKDYGQI